MPVYFIQQGNDGPIKIGFSQNVNKRLLQLKTGSPKPLYLLGAINTDKKGEDFIQFLFGEFKLKGEWFKPDRKILEFIEKYNFYQYAQSPMQAKNGRQLGFDDLSVIAASAPSIEKLKDEIKDFHSQDEPDKSSKHQTKEAFCAFCGKSFQGTHNQKYCSKECRENAILKTYICKGCGREFLSPVYRKFCSQDCGILKNCEFCKTPFRSQSFQGTHNQKYCSKECRENAILKTYICKGCGREFLSPVYRKFCSQDCGILKNCEFCKTPFRSQNIHTHIFCSHFCTQMNDLIRKLKRKGILEDEIKEKLQRTIDIL